MSIRGMSVRAGLLPGLVVLLISWVVAPALLSPAHAVCAPAAANNVSAVCTGTTVNQNNPHGYGTGVQTGVTVSVLWGASVTGTAFGIFLGANATFSIDGSVTGRNADGIEADSILSLINTGAISGDVNGVDSNGAINRLFNSGTIFGRDDDGVDASNDILWLRNTGTIRGGDDGVDSNGTIRFLHNTGRIIGGDDGVDAVGTIAQLFNSGTISGGQHGLEAGIIGSITNSGLISGGDHAIIELGAGNTSLTLLPGSILIGRIDLGGGVNVLNVGRGLSIMNTFVGGAPIIGYTGGQPFAVRGNQVAVVDPTTLAAQDDLIATFLGGVSTNVLARLNAVRRGAASAKNTGRQLASLASGTGSKRSPKPRWGIWAQGFGAWRQQDARGAASDSNISVGGATVGADRRFGRFRAGFFLGGMGGRIGTDYNRQHTDVASVVFGGYAQTRFSGFVISGMLAGGILDYDRTRTVANNLAAGGLQTATARYQGAFVSPSLTVLRPFRFRDLPFEPGLTVRYAALRVGGFRESGAADNFSASGRTIHVAQGRLHLSMPMRFRAAGGVIRVTPRVALDGRSQLGNRRVTGTLLGQGVRFDPGGSRSSLAGVGGLAVSYSRGAATFYAAAEGMYEIDGSRQASIRGGVRFRF